MAWLVFRNEQNPPIGVRPCPACQRGLPAAHRGDAPEPARRAPEWPIPVYSSEGELLPVLAAAPPVTPMLMHPCPAAMPLLSTPLVGLSPAPITDHNLHLGLLLIISWQMHLGILKFNPYPVVFICTTNAAEHIACSCIVGVLCLQYEIIV